MGVTTGVQKMHPRNYFLFPRSIIFYSQVVVTLMCISLYLGHIWPDEVYVDVVYDHTKPLG